MAQMGVVKNFAPDESNGIRIRKGIGVEKSAPQTPLPEKVPPTKNSFKHEGRETSGGTFRRIRKTLLLNRLPVERCT
jgi:hypothetical protein